MKVSSWSSSSSVYVEEVVNTPRTTSPNNFRLILLDHLFSYTIIWDKVWPVRQVFRLNQPKNEGRFHSFPYSHQQSSQSSQERRTVPIISLSHRLINKAPNHFLILINKAPNHPKNEGRFQSFPCHQQRSQSSKKKNPILYSIDVIKKDERSWCLYNVTVLIRGDDLLSGEWANVHTLSSSFLFGHERILTVSYEWLFRLLNVATIAVVRTTL